MVGDYTSMLVTEKNVEFDYCPSMNPVTIVHMIEYVFNREIMVVGTHFQLASHCVKGLGTICLVINYLMLTKNRFFVADLGIHLLIRRSYSQQSLAYMQRRNNQVPTLIVVMGAYKQCTRVL